MNIVEGAVVLESRGASVTLMPERGGAIREFSWRGRPVLRPAEPVADDPPFDMACFPMLPYANRIARGRFEFGDRTVQLMRNWSRDPHPLHGQGWGAEWDVVSADRSGATLRFEGGGDEWPWRYRAFQRFELLPDALAIQLSVENLSDEAMPVMLGLHPYFADAARAELEAHLPEVWLTDREALPVAKSQTPQAWRFDAARPVSAVALDHCFGGWDGVARLTWPDRTVTLRARGCEFLHVYVPAGRDFFCIEPQSAPAGALSRDPGEIPVLAPDARQVIEVRLELSTS